MHPSEQGFSSANTLNETDARLIWELVAKIRSTKEVLENYGLTQTDLANKLRDKMFVGAYKEAKSVWASDLNVQQRIKFKSGLLLEDSLQDIFCIIKDPAMGVTAKLEATKQLGQLSQTINPKPSAAGEGGSGFKLTINLGSDNKSVIIDGNAIEGARALTAEALA
jgi:hypothetical protein